MSPDDKSLCTELKVALALAKTEPRASVSCALSVLHAAWRIGDWKTNRLFRNLMANVLDMNAKAGIECGMTDDEAEMFRTMRSEIGGAA